MSNFAFLADEFPDIHTSAVQAETLALGDPRASAFYARLTLEAVVKWAFKHDRSLSFPYQDNLSALIHEPSFKQAAGEAVFGKARVINTLGNQAVHGHRAIPPNDALVAVRELFHVCYWLARTYGRPRCTSRPSRLRARSARASRRLVADRGGGNEPGQLRRATAPQVDREVQAA
jgi:type I restriction enzyme R subunit